MFDNKVLAEIESKVVVNNDPFPHTLVKSFLPEKITKKAEDEFIKFSKTKDAGNAPFQKTKKLNENYDVMPDTIKELINFFYSKQFIKILERKFNLENVEADWTMRGGGLHQSFKGGFLKVHSDFLYMRKSKFRRVLNLLLYLNSNWQKEWGGSIELWDKKMTSVRKSLEPELNNVVIFRTDYDSNHGFPDPMKCPENISRKSLALYYYVKEKSFLPISIRRRKYFHAVWKKRPNIEEPKFADNDNFFKRMKHRFFYRFF